MSIHVILVESISSKSHEIFYVCLSQKITQNNAMKSQRSIVLIVLVLALPVVLRSFVTLQHSVASFRRQTNIRISKRLSGLMQINVT